MRDKVCEACEGSGTAHPDDWEGPEDGRDVQPPDCAACEGTGWAKGPILPEVQAIRLPSGVLPAFTLIGSYPVFYFAGRGHEVLCAACASGEPHNVVAYDVHWEGDPLVCEECNDEIESAYGPIEAAGE